MKTLLIEFWDSYNSEESFLPLYVPLFLWISSYAYCRANGKEFYRWLRLHNTHNFGAILLGLTSMYFNDDEIFTERIPILWSIGYFVVDLVDCGLRMDITYGFHAIMCLFLGLANYHVPICRELRMNSKASLLEISNPFMHLCKKTRKPLHFAIFALVFTLCRIVWMPVLMFQLHSAGVAFTNPIQIGLALFYGLNWYWYYKILRIVFEGTSGDTAKKEV